MNCSAGFPSSVSLWATPSKRAQCWVIVFIYLYININKHIFIHALVSPSVCLFVNSRNFKMITLTIWWKKNAVILFKSRGSANLNFRRKLHCVMMGESENSKCSKTALSIKDDEQGAIIVERWGASWTSAAAAAAVADDEMLSHGRAIVEAETGMIKSSDLIAHTPWRQTQLEEAP